jgi:hypothetical protein
MEKIIFFTQLEFRKFNMFEDIDKDSVIPPQQLSFRTLSIRSNINTKINIQNKCFPSGIQEWTTAAHKVLMSAEISFGMISARCDSTVFSIETVRGSLEGLFFQNNGFIIFFLCSFFYWSCIIFYSQITLIIGCRVLQCKWCKG